MSELSPFAEYVGIELPRKAFIEHYLQSLNVLEQEEAADLAADFYDVHRPLNDVVALIPVAAHQEADNVFLTLSEYAKQQTDQPISILLYLNCPENANGDAVSQTQAEINRARQAFPYLDMRASNVTECTEPVIGDIRRTLWNSALMLAHKDGLFDSPGAEVLGLNHDIDTQYISPRYIDRIRRYYEAKQARYERLQIPEEAHTSRATVLRHAQPANHPNIGKALAWKDATYGLMAHQTWYEASIVIPFSYYVQQGGFPAGSITHETQVLAPYCLNPVIPGTLMYTSSRRYVERVGRHGLQEIWTPDSFGGNDACRDPETVLSTPDLTDYELQSVLLDAIENDMKYIWLNACGRQMEAGLLGYPGESNEQNTKQLDALYTQAYMRRVQVAEKLLRVMGCTDIAALVNDVYSDERTRTSFRDSVLV